MRAFLQRLLLFCLMLALPLQGLAAATMLACTLEHGSAPVAVEAAPACHSESEPEPVPARHDCTHCGICLHASAAPIPVVLDLPPFALVHAYDDQVEASRASHITGGPERPPRPVPV